MLTKRRRGEKLLPRLTFCLLDMNISWDLLDPQSVAGRMRGVGVWRPAPVTDYNRTLPGMTISTWFKNSIYQIYSDLRGRDHYMILTKILKQYGRSSRSWINLDLVEKLVRQRGKKYSDYGSKSSPDNEIIAEKLQFRFIYLSKSLSLRPGDPLPGSPPPLFQPPTWACRTFPHPRSPPPPAPSLRDTPYGMLMTTNLGNISQVPQENIRAAGTTNPTISQQNPTIISVFCPSLRPSLVTSPLLTFPPAPDRPQHPS